MSRNDLRSVWVRLQGRLFIVQFTLDGRWHAIIERTNEPGPFRRFSVAGNRVRLHKNHHREPGRGLYAQVLKLAKETLSK